jgi:DNA-binding winged helix-turn-helix (wHTH) protein
MTFEFGSFRVDTERLELSRSGEPVDINRRAVQLLVALVERRGDLVTKEELVRAVWGERGATLNNVAQHVFMLRSALRDTECEEYILTVPRVGYRFVGEVRHDAESAGSVIAQHYCRNARHLWSMRTQPSIASAMTLYRQALDEDPQCADAYAGLAVCRYLLAQYMVEPQAEALSAAERDAFRALEIDPRHAQALDVLGVCAAALRYAWRESEQLLLASIRERPDYLWPHVHVVENCIARGEIAQAWQALAHAQSLSASDDPFPRLPLLQGTLHYFSYAYGAAMAELTALVAEHPTYGMARHALAKALLLAGEAERAQQHVDEILRAKYDPMRPGQPNVRERTMSLAVWTRSALGDVEGARAALRQLEEYAAGRATSRICLAFAALALDEKARALGLLRDGIENHDPLAGVVAVDPLFAPLHAHREWNDILRALNLIS